MDLILPIMIVAMIIGVRNDRMTPALWALMSIAILAIIGKFAMNH